jgi:transcriptional regulator with XRE-family HTH domain
LSNAACTDALNEAFRIARVPDTQRERPIDVVLRLADAKGWTQSRLAKEMGVLNQHITNWKARGMPADQYEKAADVLDCSVDMLLSRTRYLPSALHVHAQRSAQAAALAADWDRLPPLLRTQIQRMIEAAAAEQVKSERKPKGRNKPGGIDPQAPRRN